MLSTKTRLCLLPLALALGACTLVLPPDEKDDGVERCDNSAECADPGAGGRGRERPLAVTRPLLIDRCLSARASSPSLLCLHILHEVVDHAWPRGASAHVVVLVVGQVCNDLALLHEAREAARSSSVIVP